MRLTLRTLLAYLDDTLEAEQTKLIGQKVAESPVAQELIDRIKKVTRRRSLANPPVQGDTSRLDPNTVAEYLDSTLGAEELSQVEQTCLEDDIYLAEVGACHQILTLMLSEPARVPPTARQRAYRLVKGKESIPYRSPPAFFPDERRAEPDRDAGRSDERTARLLIYLGVIAAMVLGLALAVWLAWPRSAPTRSQTDVSVAFSGPSALEVPPASSRAARPADAVNPPVAPSDTEKTKTPPMPEPSPPEPPKEAPRKPIDRIPADEPNTQRREIGRLAGNGSVLVTQSEDSAPWMPLRARTAITTRDRLMALPGYRCEVQLDAGVNVVLWGNMLEFLPLPALESLVTMNVPAAGLDADLTLDHGRIVLSNVRPKGPVRVRVRYRGEIWDIVLAEKSEVLLDGLISLVAGERFNKKAGGESPLVQLFLGVTKGSATVLIRDREPIALTAPPGPALINWDNKTRLKEPLKLNGPLPSWSPEIPGKPPGSEFKAILDRLAEWLNQSGATVELALTELTQDNRAYAQAYAGYALPAIDVISPVVDAMDELLRPNMRGTAILSLRHWVARRPENAQTLYKLLIDRKSYSEAQAEAMVQLMHTFSEEDVFARQTYEFLFQQLDDEKLAIRELAYWHMQQLDPDGDRLSMYKPTLADGRAATIERWRKRLADGKLPPKPPKPSNETPGKPN